MTKRTRKIIGYAIKVGATIGGLYLIIITFGLEPLIEICQIGQTEDGWILVGKTVVQILKMMFGICYTTIGIAICYRIGEHFKRK